MGVSTGVKRGVRVMAIWCFTIGFLLIGLSGSVFAIDVGCTSPIQLTSGVPYNGNTTWPPFTSNVSSYGCSSWSEAGPEKVHRLGSPYIKGDITAILTNLTSDLDVFILKDNGCDSETCVAGNISATYTSAPPGDHVIVVDGYGLDEFGARGPYTLTATTECSDPISLESGISYSGNTLGAGNNVVNYGCNSLFEGGPEVLHRFVSPGYGVISMTLTGLSSDLDLYVVDGCVASECLAASTASGTSNESIQFPVEAGISYDIVVDGYGSGEFPAFGPYTLTATFTPSLDCRDTPELSIDVPFAGHTSGWPSNISSYDCAPLLAESGPEVTHRYQAGMTGNVRVRLTGLISDLDLFVVADCDAGNCQYASTFGGTSDESILLPVIEGNVHEIVVDGYAGTAGPYSLLVTNNLCLGITCNDGDSCTVDTCIPETGLCHYTDVCHPPEITTTPLETARVLELYTYNVNAVDPDGDPIEYSLDVYPAGMTIDAASGMVEWVPAPGQTGVNPVTVRATDSTLEYDTQTYQISVTDSRHIFNGFVWQGVPPDNGIPMSGIQVELHGDTDADPDNGTIFLLGGQTNEDGYFDMVWIESGITYAHYHVIELDPEGMYSTGATADPPGYATNETVLTYSGISAGTYSGIWFWDETIPLNQPPDGVIDTPVGNITVEMGQTVNFSGSGTDPDGHLPLSYTWHFGAGSGIPDSSLEDPGSIRFGYQGIFMVSLTVTDSLGAVDPTPATVYVTVTLPQPTETITFEEISPPVWLTNQYCSKGVNFLDPLKFVKTLVSTSSPTHAAYTRTGEEFDQTRTMRIGFSSGQRIVSAKVGLERDYPFVTFGVTATMLAYSSPVPGGTYVGSVSLNLGNLATPITQTLSVADSMGSIGSVEIVFEGAGIGDFAYEVIDDLAFTSAIPTCGPPDTTDPTVQINEPAVAGYTVYNPNIFVDFTASDIGTGVSKTEIAFLDTSLNVLSSFSPCGDAGSPMCPQQGGTYHFGSYTWLPPGYQIGSHPLVLRVRAWDDFGNMGEDSIGLIYIQHGPNVNLWMDGLEISQATQPWVARNPASRMPGTAPPAIPYPSSPTAVPLAADRATVVRVYPSVEGTGGWQISGVKAVLRCYTDAGFSVPCNGAATIKPLELLPAGQPAQALKAIAVNPVFNLDTQQRNMLWSWNFSLPSAWTSAGTIYLEAELFLPSGLSECLGCDDGANLIRVSGITFYTTPHFGNEIAHVVQMDREVEDSGTNPPTLQHFKPTTAQITPLFKYIRRTYPVKASTVKIGFNATCTFRDNPGLSPSERCKLATKAIKKCFPDKGGRKAVVAFTDSGYGCAGVGGGGYSYSNAGGGDDTTAAHELGHALGLNHAGPLPGHSSFCPRPDGAACAECQNNWCDTDWPYAHGTMGAFGFDVIQNTVVPKGRLECDSTPGLCDNGLNEDGDVWNNGWPMIDEDCPGTGSDWTNHPHDFMSYGPCSMWVSPRNWTRIINGTTAYNFSYLTNSGPTAVVAASMLDEDLSSVPANGIETYMMLGGYLSEAEGWKFSPAYEMELPGGSNDQPGTGEYALGLFDAQGQLLFERRFDIEDLHIDLPDVDTLLSASPSFQEFVPWIPELHALRLTQNESILAELSRTPSPPEAIILSPSAEGFEGFPDQPVIRWSTSDPDGDPVFAIVQYRQDDSADWATLAADIEEELLEVDTGLMAGGSEASVRIMVSDGLNVTTVVSPWFAVEDKPPVVEIISPIDGTSMRVGDRLILEASTSDLEDGDIGEGSLRWESEIEGTIGEGSRVEFIPTIPGLHDISSTATDSAGHSGVASVMVEVLPRTNTQPVALAGLDILTDPGGMVILDGSGSYDDDEDPLAFEWMVIQVPEGADPNLVDAFSDRLEFIPDLPGTYVLNLLVRDFATASHSDTVVVHAYDPDVDTDEDGLPDWYEIAHQLEPLRNDAEEDADGDGATNRDEFEAGSDPRNESSRPVSVVIHLRPGLNIIGIPVNTEPFPDAYSLLPVLGNQAQLEAILRYAGPDFEETSFGEAGDPEGTNFPVNAGDGLLIYSHMEKEVPFSGIVLCPPLIQTPGFNLTGIPCVPDNYRAFDVLADLLAQGMRGTIQRFDSITGTFQSASHIEEESELRPVGVNFPILEGEGYILQLRELP